jgi:phage terminase large subunit-like protein
LEDQMRRLNFFPRIEELTHGNRKKTERITWSLQGRMEHGRVKLVKGEWNKRFANQLLDFPNPLVHDDLIDAVAYIDQIAVADYNTSFEAPEYEYLDITAGY